MIPVQELFAPMQKSFWSFFSTEAHSTAEIIRYINEWTRILCKKYPWYFAERETPITVATIDVINAVPETIEVLAVEKSDGSEVQNIATKLSEYKKYRREGQEVVWIWDTTFLSSSPGTFNILHSVYPTKVVSQFDSIEFPDSVKNILMEYSLAVGYLSIKDEQNAKVHLDFAESLLQNEISRKSNRSPNKVKRVSSYNF
jgi:hypothetical protein